MKAALPLLLMAVTVASACSAQPSSHAAGSSGSATKTSGRSAESRPPPFFGLDVPYAKTAALARFSELVGHRPSVFALFIRLDTTTTATRMRTFKAAGVVPFVTLEPWHLGSVANGADPRDSLTRVADGTDDTALLNQAMALRTYGGPLYLRFAHEMNANWYPWGADARGNTAALYVRAWRHVHRLFNSVAGLDVRWVWGPVTVQSNGVREPAAAFYPGDRFVDDLGITGYEHEAATASVTFSRTVRALRSISAKPIVLAEIGCDSPRKRHWLASLGPYLAANPDIRGFIYFNTTPTSTGATGDYALSTEAEHSALASTITAIHSDAVTRPGPEGGS